MPKYLVLLKPGNLMSRKLLTFSFQRKKQTLSALVMSLNRLS